MQTLSRDDLLKLEDYAAQRHDMRARVMAHKRNRKVQLGDHLTLLFEDRLTIQYQIQEMLRVERIFEAAGIQEELDAYNPLIPTGRNWKATCMIEYPDVEERRRKLEQLKGIEDLIWVQAQGHERVFAIADEDLERSTDSKTSAVHFLRFELDDDMASSLKDGASLAVGSHHDYYRHQIDPVPAAVRDALVADLD